MSQDIFNSINPATTSGPDLAVLVTAFKDAVVSGFSGAVRPPNLQAGGYWIDTSLAGAPNYIWSFTMYTGTIDVSIFKLNIQSGTVSISGSDNSFDLSRYSADAVGPILRFVKRRIGASGQVVAQDAIGEFNFVGRTDSATNPVTARFAAIASDTMTSALQGTYFVWEGTNTGAAGRSEWMRLVNGSLTLGGVTNPQGVFHVRGADGQMIEAFSDDTAAAKLVFRKSRVAGSGQVQNNDVLSQIDSQSKDDISGYSATARIQSSATQTHTSTAKGTKMSLQVMLTGGTTLVEKIAIGDIITHKGAASFESVIFEQQDVATSASVIALSGTKAILNLTGATAMTLSGIDATGPTNVISIHNASSVNVTLKNEDAAATATNRIKLPSAQNVIIKPDSSVELFYNTTQARWKLKSGSGGGGGGSVVTGSRTTPTLITAVGGIPYTQIGAKQRFYVAGDGAPIDITATLQIPVGADIGDELILEGTSDDNSVQLDSGNGIEMTSDSFVLGNRSKIKFAWDGTVWSEEWRRA